MEIGFHTERPEHKGLEMGVATDQDSMVEVKGDALTPGPGEDSTSFEIDDNLPGSNIEIGGKPSGGGAIEVGHNVGRTVLGIETNRK